MYWVMLHTQAVVQWKWTTWARRVLLWEFAIYLLCCGRLSMQSHVGSSRARVPPQYRVKPVHRCCCDTVWKARSVVAQLRD